MKTAIALCIGVFLVATIGSFGASDSDIDKLTTYAVILGRAVACGIDTSNATSRVGAWMDRTFLKNEKATYLVIMVEGMQYHAEQQRAGKSPDTCDAVRRSFAKIAWP